jgi:hypothetical protein
MDTGASDPQSIQDALRELMRKDTEEYINMFKEPNFVASQLSKGHSRIPPLIISHITQMRLMRDSVISPDAKSAISESIFRAERLANIFSQPPARVKLSLWCRFKSWLRSIWGRITSKIRRIVVWKKRKKKNA